MLCKEHENHVGMADPSFCLGMTTQSANDIVFRLSKCCAKYGAVSDSITLSEDDVELDDRHLKLTLGQQYFKMLCCPEDLLCDHILTGIHTNKECCDACELLCCKECAQHTFRAEPSMPPIALANDMMIYDAPIELYTDHVTVMEML